METSYYTVEGVDKTIVLRIMGSEVDKRVWCVGYKKDDKSFRFRNVDGFYKIDELNEVK